MTINNSRNTENTLLVAVKTGNLERVQEAIKSGALLQGFHSDESQQSLHLINAAIQTGNSELVLFLFNQGAKALHNRTLQRAINSNNPAIVAAVLGNRGDRIDPKDDSIIRAAIYSGNTEIVDLIAKAGANMNERFLIIAMESGNLEMCNHVMRNPQIVAALRNERKFSSPQTNLINAAIRGKNPEIVKMAFETGSNIVYSHDTAPPEYIDSDEEEAFYPKENTLVLAALTGNPQIFETVLEKTDRKFDREDAHNVASMAIRKGNPEIFKLTFLYMPDHKELISLFLDQEVIKRKPNPEIVEYIVQNGGSVTSQNMDKVNKALRYRAANVTAATLNITDTATNTLFVAVKSGDMKIVRRALSAGATVQNFDKKSLNLVNAAIRGGNPEIVLLLLKNGAEIDESEPVSKYESWDYDSVRKFDIKKAVEHNTLILAIESGNLEIVTVLLDNTRLAVREYQSGYSSDIILRAMDSYNPNPDILRLLVEKGANLSKEYFTKILRIASERYSVKMQDAFISIGAEILGSDSGRPSAEMNYAFLSMLSKEGYEVPDAIVERTASAATPTTPTDSAATPTTPTPTDSAATPTPTDSDFVNTTDDFVFADPTALDLSLYHSDEEEIGGGGGGVTTDNDTGLTFDDALTELEKANKELGGANTELGGTHKISQCFNNVIEAFGELPEDEREQQTRNISYSVMLVSKYMERDDILSMMSKDFIEEGLKDHALTLLPIKKQKPGNSPSHNSSEKQSAAAAFER